MVVRSKEWRLKQSEAHKNLPGIKEHMKKMTESARIKNTGRKINVTWGDKISASLKKSEIAQEKRLISMEKARLANKGRAPWNKGKKYKNHVKSTKISGENNPAKRPEVREKISRVLKEKYARGELKCGFTSEFAKSNIRKMLKKYPKISKAEMKLKEFFMSRNIPFIEQFSYKLGIADFYLPNHNMIIECYGKYWHNLENYAERDKIKNEYLVTKGFALRILWSEDIVLAKDLKTYLVENNVPIGYVGAVL